MKRRGRRLDGIFLLNKDSGMSSNMALQKTKRLFDAAKAGHTGSLDPLATGMLPICFGEATKFSQYLLDSNKSYRVVAQLGVRTTTQDAEGEVVEVRPVAFSAEQLEVALTQFRGSITQTPSMFSALKHQGQPLYKLARQGIEVERASRQVQIFRLQVLDWSNDQLTMEIDCSKGTYVRSIVDDLGQVLGCGAHVAQLYRRSVAIYPESAMLSLAQLEGLLEQAGMAALDQHLLPAQTALLDWPEYVLNEEQTQAIIQGKAVVADALPAQGWLRLVSAAGHFIGVGESNAAGLLVSKRLVAQD